MPKSLQEKFENSHAKKEVLAKPIWGQQPGDLMYISSPQEIAHEIQRIPSGSFLGVIGLRKQLANEHAADFTCPLTTGIFLRTAIEYWEEDRTRFFPEGLPFWRVVGKKDPLFKKLSAPMQELLRHKQEEEGIA
jgi:hypothetical protein